MIDLAHRKDVSLCIIANPDLRVSPSLLLWALDSGIPRRNILVHRGNDRDQVAAYNKAVELSLKMPVQWCMFADSDVMPYAATNSIWNAPFDFTCAKSECWTGLGAWADDDAFHTPMWVARAAALRALRPPWFGWTYNADHSEIEGCVCRHLAAHAKASGFTIGHTGHARHYPRGTALPDAHCIRADYTK